MSRPKQPTEWTSDNRKILETFLESETGKLALAWVEFHAPKLLDGSDVNRTLVASGCVKGYADAVSELISLTGEQPPEVQPPNSYPDLDNDALWDGAKPKQ